MTSATFEFYAGFLAFAGRAKWAAQLDDGVTVLANQSGRGEIRYHVYEDSDGRFTVTRTERAEDPETVAISTDRDIVHRYLTVAIGEGQRDMDGFLLLWSVDPDAAELMPGYRLQPLGGMWFSVVAPDGAALPVQLRRLDAITYTYVASVGLPDLYASFQDAEGKPALHDAWLRWQERRRA